MVLGRLSSLRFFEKFLFTFGEDVAVFGLHTALRARESLALWWMINKGMVRRSGPERRKIMLTSQSDRAIILS